jgi:hypothetical protein
MDLLKYSINDDSSLFKYTKEEQFFLIKEKMESLYGIYRKGNSPASFYVKGEIERLKEYYKDNFNISHLSDEEILSRVLYVIAYQQTFDDYNNEIKFVIETSD